MPECKNCEDVVKHTHKPEKAMPYTMTKDCPIDGCEESIVILVIPSNRFKDGVEDVIIYHPDTEPLLVPLSEDPLEFANYMELAQDELITEAHIYETMMDDYLATEEHDEPADVVRSKDTIDSDTHLAQEWRKDIHRTSIQNGC